jgi:hypothetical protein
MGNGFGCKVDQVVVPFDDMTSEAWGRVNAHCNNLVDFVLPDGTEKRKTWLDAYASPMDDPVAARIIHEEAVKVAEPQADAPSRSRQLAPSVWTLKDMFVPVVDDVPGMQDGRPTEAADSTTSG